MRIAITILLAGCFTLAFGQSNNPVVGTWKVHSERTGEPRAIIEIYEEDGKCHGRIVKLFDKTPDAICEKCPDDRKGKPLVGLQVIENLERDGDQWEKGRLLNPASGKTYRCSMWLEGEQLKVRGKHWTGLYKTQTWERVTGDASGRR